MEVEIYTSEEFYFEDEEDDPMQEALNNPHKYLLVEPVLPSQAFRVMADFAETVRDRHNQQRMTDTLDGKSLLLISIAFRR